MPWDHLSITRPHVVYAVVGGFTSLFMLCSSIIKERLYIGEATVATLCGVIFGPVAANLINPLEWGATDIITIEFSRIVLVVQCFAIGVELPKFYMERHWRSVIFLLGPVMAFGWLVTGIFVRWMIPPLGWVESLVVSACVTATDPVLASSVVGKGKFAKRVPRHLRDLLSAESGCNDGMAFPFVYLGLYLISDHLSAPQTAKHWFLYTILYECVFGCMLGFMIGFCARHAIRFAEAREYIDRESLLVFYFVLSLFCAGAGSLLGVDDLLVGFAAGVGFSNDGWFTEKTEESHVSNVIDLLLNLAYFVYFGTIIPWSDFNNASIGLGAWRLVVIAVMVIFFRRIPVMLALKPFIPDIHTWREALFAGHFGPIGVGAIFIALLAKGELQTGHSMPSDEPIGPDTPNYALIRVIWPIVTFIVITSIIVHGSSIAVFALGRHINTLKITMSYSVGPSEDGGSSWANRLPRLSTRSRTGSRMKPAPDVDTDPSLPRFPPGTLPPVGLPNQFLRRQRGEEASLDDTTGNMFSRGLVSRRRKSKKGSDDMGPGGPVQPSAVYPDRIDPSETGPSSPVSAKPFLASTATPADDASRVEPAPSTESASPAVSVHEEGSTLVFEDPGGDVLGVAGEAAQADVSNDLHEAAERLKSRLGESGGSGTVEAAGTAATGGTEAAAAAKPSGWSLGHIRQKVRNVCNREAEKRKSKDDAERAHKAALAYQFGNTIIVEDKDGEVIKTYTLPADGREIYPDLVSQGLRYLSRVSSRRDVAVASSSHQGHEDAETPPPKPTAASGAGEDVGPGGDDDDDDDKQVRFTIDGEGKRLTKAGFFKEVQRLDPRTRSEVVRGSSASPEVKRIAAQPGDTATTSAEPGAGGRESAGGAAQDETPAERRRREAALRDGESEEEEDEEEEEEGTGRRGIRFAE